MNYDDRQWQEEMLSVNRLTALGNQAVNLGLIAGHGYHHGQYEILRQGQVHLLTPTQATQYLENLLRGLRL